MAREAVYEPFKRDLLSMNFLALGIWFSRNLDTHQELLCLCFRCDRLLFWVPKPRFVGNSILDLVLDRALGFPHDYYLLMIVMISTYIR